MKFICRGVKQGYPLSQLLINFAMDYCIDGLIEKLKLTLWQSHISRLYYFLIQLRQELLYTCFSQCGLLSINQSICKYNMSGVYRLFTSSSYIYQSRNRDSEFDDDI